jgi:hypothetical protein
MKQRKRNLGRKHSCPGIMTFTSRIQAFAKPIHNFILRTLTKAMIVITYPIMSVLWMSGVVTDPMTSMSTALNNRDLVGQSSRAYIYSNADALVQSWAVEKHSMQASKLDISTKLHNFRTTTHVMHMPNDRTRYIAVIKEQCKKALYGSVFFDSV